MRQGELEHDWSWIIAVGWGLQAWVGQPPVLWGSSDRRSGSTVEEGPGSVEFAHPVVHDLGSGACRGVFGGMGLCEPFDW